MNIYENQLKEHVKEIKKMGKEEYGGEEKQDVYRRIYSGTVNSIKEYLRKNFKNIGAYRYWTDNDDRVLTLFDGDHNDQIDIVLGR